MTLNNVLAGLRLRWRRSRFGSGVLLLFPSCLQNPRCGQKILEDLGSCRRCGECKVGPLLEMAARYGVRPSVAPGGEIALQKVRGNSVTAVVAIACDRELRQGIISAFPKPVFGVRNSWPKGPCYETDVDLARVERAIGKIVSW